MRNSTPPTSPEAIREALSAQKDENYKSFACSLMPTVAANTVMGVRTPALRRMARSLFDTRSGDAFLRDLPHAYFEENQLHAFLIEPIRDFDTAVAAVDGFLPFVDNWATCDQMSPRAFKGRFTDLLPHIRRWMADPAPYICRFGIGMLMRYGLDGDFDPSFPAEVAAPAIADREEYYVRMMVAWYFATALAKQYDTVLPYIAERRLPVWTHNKTIQKACESYRVTAEHKAVLKAWRR